MPYARALDVPGLDEKQTSTAKERIAALEKSLGTAQVTLRMAGRSSSTPSRR